jgi:hypothetical protein
MADYHRDLSQPLTRGGGPGISGEVVSRSGFGLAAVASLWNSETESYETHEIRAEFTLTGAQAKAHLALLEADKAAIEAEVGQSLIWHNPPDTHYARIYVRRTADLRGPPGATGEKFTISQKGHETSLMRRNRCRWKNYRLCGMGTHARMLVPPSFAAP